MRAEKAIDNLSVHTRAIKAADRTTSNGKLQIALHSPQETETETDSPFPFLEVMLKRAKDSPFVVIGVMISIAAIIVGAIVSFTVGFGLFLFSLNGTVHELKTQNTAMLQQLAAVQKQQAEDGNAYRAYAANEAQRGGFIVGLMTPNKQEAVNGWDRSHPRPLLPPKRIFPEIKEN